MKIDNFFSDLNRCYVCKVAVVYAIVRWFAPRVAATLGQAREFGKAAVPLP